MALTGTTRGESASSRGGATMPGLIQTDVPIQDSNFQQFEKTSAQNQTFVAVSYGLAGLFLLIRSQRQTLQPFDIGIAVGIIITARIVDKEIWKQRLSAVDFRATVA